MKPSARKRNADPAAAPSGDQPKEDIVVFITRHEGRCAECSGEFFPGNFIRVDNGRTLCLDCADLGHLEPHALSLAVVAHIRHAHTDYDRLLGKTDDRERARQVVRPDIERVLAQWTAPPGAR